MAVTFDRYNRILAENSLPEPTFLQKMLSPFVSIEDPRLIPINALFREIVVSKYPAEVIDHHWEELSQQAGLNSGDKDFLSLDEAAFAKVVKAFQEVVAGVETKGYTLLPDEETHLTRAQQLLKIAFYDLDEYATITWQEFYDLFIHRNEELIAEVRETITHLMPTICKQLNEPGRDGKIAEMVVGHLLSFYAFCEPENAKGGKVFLPQKIDDKWTMVDFIITTIELTSPLTLGASPVPAYGLKPDEDFPDASPILLFRGTPPHPTASGFGLSYQSDFIPVVPVGSTLHSKKKIGAWIGGSEKPIHAYGISLGGSLAHLAARDFPEKIEVHTFVPPGFPTRHYEGTDAIRGESFCHVTDPVSSVGFFPAGKGYRFFRVLTEKARNTLQGHGRMMGVDQKSLIMRVDAEYENSRIVRTIRTIAHQLFSIPATLVINLILLGNGLVQMLAGLPNAILAGLLWIYQEMSRLTRELAEWTQGRLHALGHYLISLGRPA